MHGKKHSNTLQKYMPLSQEGQNFKPHYPNNLAPNQQNYIQKGKKPYKEGQNLNQNFSNNFYSNELHHSTKLQAQNVYKKKVKQSPKSSSEEESTYQSSEKEQSAGENLSQSDRKSEKSLTNVKLEDVKIDENQQLHSGANSDIQQVAGRIDGNEFFKAIFGVTCNHNQSDKSQSEEEKQESLGPQNNSSRWVNLQSRYYEKSKCFIAPKPSEIPLPF